MKKELHYIVNTRTQEIVTPSKGGILSGSNWAQGSNDIYYLNEVIQELSRLTGEEYTTITNTPL